MAKKTLPTNYKDDVLANAMSGKRRYKEIQNTDGTVSFEDVTDYTQIGSTFGAGQINEINTAANNSFDKSKIIDDCDTLLANTQSGYAAGALAVKGLNSNLGKLDFGDFITYSKTTEISKIQLSAMEVGKWYEMVIHTSKTEGALLDSVGCEDVTSIRIVPSYAGRSLFLVNFKATAETVEININGIGQVSYILRKLT